MQRAAGRRRDPRTDTAALDAVLDLVAAGATLSGLSLVTIAEHAGVSRNSLYRRWKTKDALYLDVLDAINRALPEFTGPSVREDLAAYLAELIRRTLDPRAAAVLRALQAEAAAFPELHRRYFDEIVAPAAEPSTAFCGGVSTRANSGPTWMSSSPVRFSSRPCWPASAPVPSKPSTRPRPAAGSSTCSTAASKRAEA